MIRLISESQQQEMQLWPLALPPSLTLVCLGQLGACQCDLEHVANFDKDVKTVPLLWFTHVISGVHVHVQVQVMTLASELRDYMTMHMQTVLPPGTQLE